MVLNEIKNRLIKFFNTRQPQIKFIALATIICISIALVAELLIFNKIIPHSGGFYFAWVRFISVAVICLVAVLLVRFRQFFLQYLEYTFLIIALSIGTLFILVLPRTVYVSQDDQIHLQRAVTLLSSSDISWSKAFRMLEIPTTTTDGMTFEEVDNFYHQLNLDHEATKDQTANFGNNSFEFSRLAYLPYFIGFKISSFLHLSFTSMIAVAKLCNFLCYVLILFLAIKISTHAKKIFFVLSLLLSNIFFATQFSCDPAITSSIMFAIALFLRMLEMQHIPASYILAFIVAITWASLPKAIYCPLLLLLLFVPNRKFGNQQRAVACKIATISLMLLVAATFVLPIVSGGMLGDFRGGDTSVSRQILHILHNPLHFFETFLRYTTNDLPGLLLAQLTSVGGYPPYYYTRPILPAINLIYIIFFGYVTFTSCKPSKVYTKSIRIVMLFMYFIVVYCIMGALYLSFTPVGLSYIEGVQDRYLLPILPLALILLIPTAKTSTHQRKDKTNFVIIAIPFLVLVLFLTCFILRTSIF